MTEKLLDPDCRNGKHTSCVGDPCQCRCHDTTQHDPTRDRLRAMTDSSPPEDCPRNLLDCVAALEDVLDRCDEILGQRFHGDPFFDGRDSAARLIRDIITRKLAATEEQQ